MIAAMSKKGYGETVRILTHTRREEFVATSLQLHVESPLAGPNTTILVGSAGWRASSKDRKGLQILAHRKSDGGQKLRTTCSERIRAKRRHLPPTPSALYEGNPLKIIVRTTGVNNDH